MHTSNCKSLNDWYLISNSTRALQQIIKLSLLALQIRVATNMLLSDEDVRHATLAGYFLERILDRGAVI